MLISNGERVVEIDHEVKRLGRSTQGVIVMRLRRRSSSMARSRWSSDDDTDTLGAAAPTSDAGTDAVGAVEPELDDDSVEKRRSSGRRRRWRAAPRRSAAAVGCDRVDVDTGAELQAGQPGSAREDLEVPMPALVRPALNRHEPSPESRRSPT